MATTINPIDEAPETLWYLAYGSNMDPKIFSGRRKIQPIESKNVIVPGYWLSFDIGGVPYVEPCFGSILKIDESRLYQHAYAKEVYDRTQFGSEFLWNESHPDHPQRSYPPTLQGVAHKITLREWQMVIESEGGWGHDVPTGYNQIEVNCTLLDTNEQISAHVLESRPLSVKSQCQPSLRYKNLLTAGAAYHNVDPAYQRYLASIVPYKCEGVRPKIGRALYVVICSPMLFVFAFIFFNNGRKPVEKRSRPPYWAAWCIDRAGRFSNSVHDYVIAPIFGSGRHSSPAQRLLARIKIEEELKKEKSLAEHQKCMEAQVDRENIALKFTEEVAESTAE